MTFVWNAFSALHIFFFALGLAAFGVEAWALGDAVRRPAGAFSSAGKLTKQLWLIILGVGAVVGLAFALFANVALSILPVAAFVAAAVYLTDVKPKIKDFRKGGGSGYGPYGPW
ncbi:MAG TPA: DUF2516 family protein [Streptosporangiaceae bacterium]|nr:DUF2516 family protein [Streptosporangiaceae bacterium]